MSNIQKLVLAIGGTGAQGTPVVKALAADSKYAVRVLTRNASSEDAKELSSLPGVTIFEGDAYSEPTLRQAFVGVSAVFINTNGFAIGEKAEIYWGIRLYELAREFGVEHFLYAGLEYGLKLGNFDPQYRCGHLDGKGKVVDFLKSQPTRPMRWSVLTSCLYMENLSGMLKPYPSAEDPETLVFGVPLGEGECPLIYLEDYGAYARWILDTPERSNGLELHVGTEDIAWKDLAKAFTETTGKKAVYRDVSFEEYFASGSLGGPPDAIIGQSSINVGDPTLQTIREDFVGFWNTWKDNLTTRDYALLDEILPGRVKSVKEWMVKTGYTGEKKTVLKDHKDKGH